MDKDNFDEIYLELFLEETREQIQSIEERFLQFEQENSYKETINEIFRLAHSIKGSAAVMGFSTMNKLAHNMENLLDMIRNKEVIKSDEIVDVLFVCIDKLKVIHKNIECKNTINVDISDVIIRINSIIDDKSIESREQYVENSFQGQIPEAMDLTTEEEELCNNVEKGSNIYRVKVTLDEKADMKCIKGYMLIRNISSTCNVIKSEPQDFENLNENEFDGVIKILISTDEDVEYITRSIGTISEVKEFSIDKVLQKSCSQIRETGNLKDVTKKSKENINESKEIEKPYGVNSEKVNNVNKNTNFKKDSTVRIDTKKIDKLLNLVGEFIVDKETLNEIALELREKHNNDPLVNKFFNLIPHLNYIGSELQEAVMSTRMMSLDNVFNRFPRMVRDLAKRCNKSIKLDIEGRDTEIDKEIIEELIDPLTHIIRNAIDHGIENSERRVKVGKDKTAMVKLSGRHEGNNVVIEIEDDGRGIDSKKIKKKLLDKGICTEEKINLLTEKDIIKYIFEPGFSTASEVSDISGRGVGLDVVKSNIGKLNGLIDIETKVGMGTKFIIKLPLTLAISKALLVKEKEYMLAIPISAIVETLRLKGRQEIKNSIYKINDVEMFKWRDEFIPLVRMNNYFEAGYVEDKDRLFVVIVGHAQKKAALIVEGFLNEREIVIKSMEHFIGKNKLFGEIEGISGVSILGDGGFAYILDLVAIMP